MSLPPLRVEGPPGSRSSLPPLQPAAENRMAENPKPDAPAVRRVSERRRQRSTAAGGSSAASSRRPSETSDGADGARRPRERERLRDQHSKDSSREPSAARRPRDRPRSRSVSTAGESEGQRAFHPPTVGQEGGNAGAAEDDRRRERRHQSRHRHDAETASHTSSRRDTREGSEAGGREPTAAPVAGQKLPPIPRDALPAPTPGFTGEAARRLEARTREAADHPNTSDAYAFHEDTGLLRMAAVAGDGQGERRRVVYVEQPNCHFVKINDKGKQGFFQRLRRGTRQHQTPDADAFGVQDDEALGGSVAVLKKAVDGFQSFAALVSLMSQGLLGGLGFTNLIMTYFSSPAVDLTGFLRYYSPMAMVLNRYYYVLVCFALVAAINKYARNSFREFKPFGYRQRLFDMGLIILYAGSYAVCVVITPYDDLLTYNSMRVPDYYNMKLSPTFMGQLRIWHALSLTRMISVTVAWFVASLEFSPMCLLVYWRFSYPPRLVTVFEEPAGEPAMHPEGQALPLVANDVTAQVAGHTNPGRPGGQVLPPGGI